MTDSDPLAAERFRTIVTDALCESGENFPALAAEPVLQRFPEAYFEHRINARGVPVRRVVVVGEWEVDPAPVPAAVEPGDIVHYADREHGEHSDWIVTSVLFRAVNPDHSIVLVRRPEWAASECVNTTGQHIRIVSRPKSTNRDGTECQSSVDGICQCPPVPMVDVSIPDSERY